MTHDPQTQGYEVGYDAAGNVEVIEGAPRGTDDTAEISAADQQTALA